MRPMADIVSRCRLILMRKQSGLVLWSSAVVLAAVLSSCYTMRPSSGAGEDAGPTPRALSPAAIAVPTGYELELITSGLTFPVGAAVDDRGVLHVVESGYAYGEDFTEPRLLRIEANNRAVPIASGGKGGPWTGVVF